MFNKLYSLYKTHFYVFYIATLVVIVAVMPHSRGLLSSSQIGLAVLWLLEGNFKRKFDNLKANKSILIFSSIFFIHIIGIIYSENIGYALKDLKIKLPLLLFPVVIGTSVKLGFKEIKLIVTVFTISLLLKTMYGLAVLVGITGKEISDVQEIAGKFSHIRYALLLNIAVFSNFYLFFFSPEDEKLRIKVFQISSIIWLSIFLFILHSVTGWVIFFVLLIFTSLFIAFNSSDKKLQIISILSVLIIAGGSFTYLAYSAIKFYKSDFVEVGKIKNYTKSGNPYVNNFKSNERENGHFVNLYLCEKEIKEEWNKISDFKYDGRDKKDQPIKFTLIRYLTSKNYRKDKEGVQELTEKDIENIETGIANYIYERKYALYPKIYEILWQTEQYMHGGSPENHSVTQRIEFIKIGKEIIKGNLFFGVGTGDVKDEFLKQYEKSASQLSKKNRLRAHNQYITFFITFGIVGFIWIIFAYIYAPLKERKFKDYLFLIVFITMSLSMLNEDTLETQMGATIFAFFMCLYLFSNPLEILRDSD
ncbi:MAG: O-antigen ligase family protein [Bacteroidales bacterium]|nr:O-antigen ligase family protein [Bacteroidales bacterium]